MRYATRLTAPDPFYLLAVGSTRHLLVSALEAARARKSCPAAILCTTAQLADDLPGASRTWERMVAVWIRRLGYARVDVGPYFPLGPVRALEKEGIDVHLSCLPPFPNRAIKTSREVRMLEQSQCAAVAAMRSALECIRRADVSRTGELKRQGRPLTSERIKEVIEETLLKHTCCATGTIVAIGPQGARPHEEGSGPLRTGQPVVIDIFPRNKSTGYWGDITRTVVRGPVSPEWKKIYRTVLGAQKKALSMVRPGVEFRAVQQAVETYFAAAGYPTDLSEPGRESGFIHSVGHGVGLDIHESPGLRNEPGFLAVGHVVTVEPGLYLPGRGGVRIEDTVVVTKTGCRLLAVYPKRLVL